MSLFRIKYNGLLFIDTGVYSRPIKFYGPGFPRQITGMRADIMIRRMEAHEGVWVKIYEQSSLFTPTPTKEKG